MWAGEGRERERGCTQWSCNANAGVGRLLYAVVANTRKANQEDEAMDV